jgi:hypothetical protein
LYDEFREVLSASDSRLDHQKLSAAFAARLLVEKLSKRKLTINSNGNTPFCVIASQLFEVISGKGDCDIIRACRLCIVFGRNASSSLRPLDPFP